MKHLMAAVVLALITCGCANTHDSMLRPLLNPATDGAPATWPCNASG
jgi:hypothetical protein